MSVAAAALIAPMAALPQIPQLEPSELISFRIIVLGTAVEAEQVIKRVQDGESFPHLAKALSIDPTADTGGLVSATPRSALRPELRDALTGLEPGQITRVVRVPTGFAVLQLACVDKLVGVKTNRAALGARITVTVEDAGRVRRQIHRTVGSGGSFGASPLEQHIGLGASARTVDVEVWWPTSETRQHFAGAGKNQTLEIRELSASLKRLERPRVSLARATAEATHVP